MPRPLRLTLLCLPCARRVARRRYQEQMLFEMDFITFVDRRSLSPAPFASRPSRGCFRASSMSSPSLARLFQCCSPGTHRLGALVNIRETAAPCRWPLQCLAVARSACLPTKGFNIATPTLAGLSTWRLDTTWRLDSAAPPLFQ